MSMKAVEYSVYNEKNQLVKINSQQIDESFINTSESLSLEVIIAMGRTYNQKYLSRLYEVLDSPNRRKRQWAMKSILNLGSQQSISVLENKLEKIYLNHEKETEFYFLQGIILLLKQNREDTIRYFLDLDTDYNVKKEFIYMYANGYNFKLDDITFIITILKTYLNKEQEWIKSMVYGDYEDAIIVGLEVIWTITEDTDLLEQIEENVYRELLNVCKKVYSIKIDSYAKEIIAIFVRGLSVTRAYEVLEPIINTAKGEVKKEVKKTLKYLEEMRER